MAEPIPHIEDGNDSQLCENHCGGESTEDSPALFKLSGVDTTLGDSVLEDSLTKFLSIPIALLEKNYNGEEGTILFCRCSLFVEDEEKSSSDDEDEDDRLLSIIRERLEEVTTATSPASESSSPSEALFRKDASDVSVTILNEEEDECVEYITEEEAYLLWLEQNNNSDNDNENEDEDEDEGHLVSSPDGALVRPRHHTRRLDEEEEKSEGESVSNLRLTLGAATEKQLKRDPGLLDFDNVLRVHCTEILELLSSPETKDVENTVAATSSSSSVQGWRESFGSQPIMIYGIGGPTKEDSVVNTANENSNNASCSSSSIREDLIDFSRALRDIIVRHGADTIVRTGNRETLVKNGFHNSRPATLSDATTALLPGCSKIEYENEKGKPNGTIIFNPIHEMPAEFRSESVLGRWIDDETKPTFPNRLWRTILTSGERYPSSSEGNINNHNKDSGRCPKFTLCMANEGFGIGMHKHGPALFFLTEGRKKWYLSHPGPIDERIAAANDSQESGSSTSSISPTHPGFYAELSTHKCIQEPGELLLVPNLWYHEIYNLASPTIGIQALGDELPVPGALP
jgi:hypothetical protein